MIAGSDRLLCERAFNLQRGLHPQDENYHLSGNRDQRAREDICGGQEEMPCPLELVLCARPTTYLTCKCTLESSHLQSHWGSEVHMPVCAPQSPYVCVLRYM